MLVVFGSVAFDTIRTPTKCQMSMSSSFACSVSNAGSSSPEAIKKAITYGNVMGSMTVQGYGTAPLLHLKKSAIEKRAREYRKITGV